MQQIVRILDQIDGAIQKSKDAGENITVNWLINLLETIDDLEGPAMYERLLLEAQIEISPDSRQNWKGKKKLNRRELTAAALAEKRKAEADERGPAASYHEQLMWDGKKNVPLQDGDEEMSMSLPPQIQHSHHAGKMSKKQTKRVRLMEKEERIAEKERNKLRAQQQQDKEYEIELAKVKKLFDEQVRIQAAQRRREQDRIDTMSIDLTGDD